MWGSRTRHAKRNKSLIPTHDYNSVRLNVKRKSTELDIEKANAIKKYTEKKRKLNYDIKQLTGKKNIRKVLRLKVELKQIDEKLQYYDKDLHMAEFVELLQSILYKDDVERIDTKQAKHALYLKIFYPEKAVPCFSDRDTCPICHIEFKMIMTESKVLCPGCGFSELKIFCNSDFIDNKNVKNNTYVRALLYKKFLLQFHEDEPETPRTVKNVIYKHLSKVHIMSSSSVKSTPVAQILREEGLQKHTSKAVKISKDVNGEFVVKLSMALINKLVWRFIVITSISSNHETKKCINFGYLTNKLLLMEKEYEKAEWFENHKTRTVLKRADERLKQCCSQIDSDDSTNWAIYRSC